MECESTTRPCIVRMQIEFIRSVGLEKGPSARNLKNATLGEMLLVDVCKAHPCPGPSCRFEGRDGRMSIEHGWETMHGSGPAEALGTGDGHGNSTKSSLPFYCTLSPVSTIAHARPKLNRPSTAHHHTPPLLYHCTMPPAYHVLPRLVFYPEKAAVPIRTPSPSLLHSPL